VPSSGWRSRLEHGAWSVSEVDPLGPARLLQTGDEVLSVNGHTLSWLGPKFRLLGTFPGQSYALKIKRQAETLSLRLLIVPDASVSKLTYWPNLFIASLMFLSGLWMMLGGPRDITARLGSALFLGGAIAMLGWVFLAYPGWSLETAWLATLLARAPRPLVTVLGWDFLSRFPRPMSEGRSIRLLRLSLYAIGTMLAAAINLPVLGELLRLPIGPFTGAIEWMGWNGPYGEVPNGIFDAAVSFCTCYIVIRNYKLVRDVVARRKIRWAAASFGLGALCMLFLQFFNLMTSVSTNPAWKSATRSADALWTVAIALIPLALTYAVVKHRVLGVRLVVRLGLQYLLAKNVLRLIVFAPVLIVLLQIVQQPNESISDLVFRSSWRFYLLLMLTAAFSLRYRRQLSRWLDRRFFRVALQEEEAWAALGETVKAAATENEIAAAVAHQIGVVAPVQALHVLFREPSDGRLHAYFSTSMREGQRLIQQLERNRGSMLTGISVFSVVEEESASDSAPEAQQMLVVPLLGADGRNLGAFVLGPKKSEQQFTRRERELLQAIAAQVVMACEVLRLRRSIDRESRQRISVLGRLDRENIQLLNECLVCGRCYDSSEQRCRADQTPLELTLPVERVVVGRYRLDRRLGAGGMGVVYEAQDFRLNKVVAVKIMIGELFGNRRALARFKREAQSVASLRHPNIVGVHDFGELPAGGAFLVMDLVTGVLWRKHLRVEARLLPERVASWIEDLCAGVAAAHRSNVIHRDLKPENVMIWHDGERETAMILDFGLAKLHANVEETVAVSLPGTIVGTRSYMSPEQRKGEPVDRATDIYSIAVMALETLSRLSPPKEGVSGPWAREALDKFARQGSALPAIFDAALQEAPQARMQSVEQLGSTLSAAIRLEKPLVGGSSSDDAETLSLDTAI